MIRVMSWYSCSDPSQRRTRSGLHIAATSSTQFRSFLFLILPAAPDTGASTCAFAMYCLSSTADKNHMYHTSRNISQHSISFDKFTISHGREPSATSRDHSGKITTHRRVHAGVRQKKSLLPRLQNDNT